MNIYWMKRDFRLQDNKALLSSLSGECLAITVFEPSYEANYDFDLRHWRFIYQSILDLRKKGLNIHILHGEVIDVLSFLLTKYKMIKLFSHEETGNDLTYKRDIHIKQFTQSNGIQWQEYPTNAVIRGLKKCQGWDALWIKHIKAAIPFPPTHLNASLFDKELANRFSVSRNLQEKLKITSDEMLKGGEGIAHRQLADFLNNKIEQYWGSISYPDKSRYYCSMLSPYISWGNITIRQIYQECEKNKKHINNKKSLQQFMARLKWHCHFIQKLELQPNIEFKNLSTAFDGVRQKKNKAYINAWKKGQTGYPLIDAAMRCVQKTGYLNFRLRSTVASFLTHILWQPWQAGVGYLARQFLDYEPGIHFSQFQMQAGTTGINMIRIYNPIKQSKEKDKDGTFIKRWVPELKNIPKEFIHEPWLMTDMDQLLYQFKLGVDYPVPIVDFDSAYKKAQDKLWSIKKSDSNKKAAQRILKKHARRNNKVQ
jgi:deoxyribodipyrimidine photo-lyase